jgi:trigger factor
VTLPKTLEEGTPDLNSTETKPESPTGTTEAGEHPHDHGHGHHHAPAMNPECKREVSIEIPADFVKQETDKLVRKYQKIAKIPGFRAGKVPESIIRSRFAEEIRSEVLDALLPQYFRAEVQKQGLAPVSQPYVGDLHFTEGEPVRFKASFEVLPQIEPKGYKDLRAEKQDITVSDAEVSDTLKHLQERQASFEPVEDRPAQDGDFVQVSFTGLSKGTVKVAEKKAEIAAAEGETAAATPSPENKPVEVKDVLVEIGGSNTVKEFTENLLGTNAGDERTFDVTYGEDFSDKRLAGQVMAYAVQVQGVKKKNLPELDDDFAKELGDFKSLDELKAKIRENIEVEKRHSIQHTAKEKLIDELVEKNQFPVPEALVERQTEVRLERGFRALAQQGMRAEDMRKMNFQRLREGQRDAAIREVRASLLLDKIAELETIDATDEDLERELHGAANQTGQSVEEIRTRLTKDGSLDRIRDRIRNEKALDFLYNQSA